MAKYQDITVRVTPQPEDKVFITIDGPAPDADIFQFAGSPQNTLDQVRDLLEIEFRLRPLEYRLPQQSPFESLKALGTELFIGLFHAKSQTDPSKKLWDKVKENLEKVENKGARARLIFQFDPSSELAIQPWELIHTLPEDQGEFIARRHEISLVRSVPAQGAKRMKHRASNQPGPLNILVVMANPTDPDYPPLDLEEAELRNSLSDLDTIGRIKLDFIQGRGTFKKLTNYVTEIQSHRNVVYVVHIVAHGRYGNEGELLFEAPNGASLPVTATDLATELSRIKGLRLVVLNACHGGARLASRPFSSIAEKLIAKGVPSVVAMQFEVSNEAALVFAETFYGAIGSGLFIDEALSLSRSLMSQVRAEVTGARSIEWCTPVLFLHEHCTETTPLLQTMDDEAYLKQAEEWHERGEHERALSACRLIKKKKALVPSKDDVQKRAGDLLNLVGGAVHRYRMDDIIIRREYEKPEKLIAECSRILDDLPHYAAAKKIKNDAEEELKEELHGLFSQGVEALHKRDLPGAQSGFIACADRANEILRHAKQCKSAVDYFRPAEIAGYLCFRFEEGEGYLAQKGWEEAGNAFHKIVDLRLDIFGTHGLLDDLQPLQEEAQWLFHYSEGRQAEDQRNWDEAVSVYTLLPGKFRDVGERRAYCQGRSAEKEGHWADAAKAYSHVHPRRYPDAPHRLQYAEGRAVEEKGEWPAAVAAYDQLPTDFEDVKDRLPYVQGREAEANEDWAAVLEAWQPLSDAYPDLAPRRAEAQAHIYQAGREAERQGRWDDAVRAYASLPLDYEDVQKRLPYVNGRAAEDEDKWAEAVASYERIADSEGVAQRLPYAQGRAAEQAAEQDPEQWKAAAAAYQKLKRYEDSAQRHPYCLGRIAEARDDWEGVIKKFGNLPDTYRDGDVGHRRLYARGRKAEAKEKWEGAISKEGYGGLPDNYRDVGERHRYAKGRLAAEQGNWDKVGPGLGRLKNAYRQGSVGKWRWYARGRLADAEGDWQNAAKAFRKLPGDFEDAGKRFAYAKGRTAEQEAKWRGVLDAFQDLEDTYREGDIERRKAYATGRIAIEQCEWEAAQDAFARLQDFQDASQLLQYASGRRAAEDGEWEAALSALKLLKGWWIEEVSNWTSYARGRYREASGQWGAALEAYPSLPDTFQDVGQRRERLTRLLDVVPWLDGLARAHLVRDPAGLWDGTFPYDALLPAGITPDSPGQAMRDASFVLMEKGLMTPEGRLAWDQLRTVAGRLRVDALMYRLRDVKAIRDLQRELEPAEEADILRRLHEAVPDDEPLMFLLQGDRQAAIAAWEEQQRRNPGDAWMAHALAIAHLFQAKELEAGGAYEQAEVAWEQAITHWAFLLTDDAYWHVWRRDRAARYQETVSENDTAHLRSQLGEYIAKELAQYADRYQLEGRKERAAQYQQLALTFEVELEGARTLKEVGGLPFEDGSDARLSCGLALVRHLALEHALAQLILDLAESLERETEDPVDVVAALEAVIDRAEAQPLPTVTPEGLHRLRCAFSELGKAVVLLDRHRYEEALHALPADYYQHKMAHLPPDCDASERGTPGHLKQCDRCQEFVRVNPAYLCLPHRATRLFRDAAELAVRIHLEAAQAALTSDAGDLDEPFRHWKQAIDISRNAGTPVRTKQAIGRVALGRTAALGRERGQQRRQRLTQAIDLLEAVRTLVGGVDAAQLKAEQSQLLIDRGIWYGYGSHNWEDPDYEKAAGDLRRALELNPSSLRARDNLARALVFHASNLHHIGQRQQPMSLLDEALVYLFGDPRTIRLKSVKAGVYKPGKGIKTKGWELIKSGMETFAEIQFTFTSIYDKKVEATVCVGKCVGDEPEKFVEITGGSNGEQKVRLDYNNYIVDYFNGADQVPVTSLFKDPVFLLVREVVARRHPKSLALFRPEVGEDILTSLQAWRRPILDRIKKRPLETYPARASRDEILSILSPLPLNSLISP